MYKPCLETPKIRRKDFDKSLCIVCQKKVDKPKRGRPKVVDASSFDIFNKVFKILEDNGDVSYHHIYEVTKSKSSTNLKDENFCYHSKPCRSKFLGILGNHERTLVVVESAKNAPTTSKNTKISRKVTKSFNKELCLFCQIDLENESSFNLCQDSRDAALKEALEECPNSLSLYKIRSSHAFDGMAGDLKYHHSCWRNVIDKRVPEVYSQSRLKPANRSSPVARRLVIQPNEFELNEYSMTEKILLKS